MEEQAESRRTSTEGRSEWTVHGIRDLADRDSQAMEKYKSDCILINSFSARLALTQGKDLDKVTQKLDKAQQTVQMNGSSRSKNV